MLSTQQYLVMYRATLYLLNAWPCYWNAIGQHLIRQMGIDMKTSIPKLHSFKPKNHDAFIKPIIQPKNASKREVSLGWGKVIFICDDDNEEMRNSTVVYMCNAVMKIVTGG